MCGYCARELNPELIARLRNELPDTTAATVDANNSGNAALVNAEAVVASGGFQLQDEGISFRPAVAGPSANKLADNDAFVFDTPKLVAGNGSLTSWLELRLSNLTEQEVPSMSLPTTDTPETAFWTYQAPLSIEDWLF